MKRIRRGTAKINNTPKPDRIQLTESITVHSRRHPTHGLPEKRVRGQALMFKDISMKKPQVIIAILIGFAAPLRRVLVTFMLLCCYPCWAQFTAIQGWVKGSGANTCTTNVAPTGAGHVGIFCTTNFSDNNFFSSVSGGGSWT